MVSMGLSSKRDASATLLQRERERSEESGVRRRTTRANGNRCSSSSVDFWYLRISRRATVPALKRWGLPGATGSPAVEW